jgi:hypothetical protein
VRYEELIGIAVLGVTGKVSHKTMPLQQRPSASEIPNSETETQHNCFGEETAARRWFSITCEPAWCSVTARETFILPRSGKNFQNEFDIQRTVHRDIFL